MSKSFGITEETKSNNQVPFQPNEAKPITRGFLTSVSVEDRELKSDKSKKSVLVFKFIDEERKRHHNHIEWELDPNDEKFDAKLEAMQVRIKHIYEGFKPFSGSLGAGATNSLEFFNAIAKEFNEGLVDGDKKSPIYTNRGIWIKAIYSTNPKFAKGGLQLPYSPNFIEPIVAGKASTLQINKTYETLIQPTAKTVTPSDMPNLGGGGGFSDDGGPF